MKMHFSNIATDFSIFFDHLGERRKVVIATLTLNSFETDTMHLSSYSHIWLLQNNLEFCFRTHE